MTQSVNGMNRSMRTLVNDALARRQAAEDLKQSYYADAIAREQAQREAELARREAELNSTTVQTGDPQQPQQTQQAVSPLDDPESALSKLIKERGMTREDYMKLSTAERQYDFADPILENKWNTYVAANPDVAQQSGEQLQRTKDAFFNQGRNLYAANFQAKEDAESAVVDRLKNVAGDAVEGVAGLFTSAGGLLKPAFGNDNIVSKGLEYVGKSGEEFGKGLASDAERDREAYFYRLMEAGRYKDAAKFAADNPLMLGGEAAQMIAGTKGFGLLTKGTAKLAGKGLSAVGAETLSKGVNAAGQAIGNSMPTYAGMSVGGQVANELAERGIDTTSPEARLAVAMSFIGGAAANKITPHNIENQVAKWGLSKEAAKTLSRESIETLEKLGFMGAAGKRLGGTLKNAIKGGVNEGAEEAMQEGLGAYAAQALIDENGKFRNWDEVPENVKQQVLRRATTGGLLGAALGGTTAGVANGAFGGVQGDLQRRADYETSKAKYAEEDRVKAEEEKAAAEAQAQEEARIRAEEDAQKRATLAELDAAQEKAEREAEYEQALNNATRTAEADDELNNLRTEFGASAIDSNEVATNRARREYDDYLNSQYEALMNSEELTDEQRDILANTWGDGNRTLRAKANLLQQLGVDTMPEQFTRTQKNGKVVFNRNLDKHMDYRADELTQSAQAVYDDADTRLTRLRAEVNDPFIISDAETALKRAADAGNEGALRSALAKVKQAEKAWDTRQKELAEQAKLDAKAQQQAEKEAQAAKVAAEKAALADAKNKERLAQEAARKQEEADRLAQQAELDGLNQARDGRLDNVVSRIARAQAVKNLTRAEQQEVKVRIEQDNALVRDMQEAYASRLKQKDMSEAEARATAYNADFDTLFTEYRPNKLSNNYKRVKDRLPENDGLWWTPQERATVKAEIEDFFKEAGVTDTVDIKNLRASVEGINSLRRNMPPELQEKANAIVSAISTGTPVGVMKQAGKRAIDAATKVNSLKPVEDFTGKSQAPSKGRQMRKANAETKRSTS
jgi:hypothetical protein|nr:MAG TPA: hypothetical protein [Caudoviricetes sp.]